MDGDFISTDIHYRDGPINIKTKTKTKRKNAASYFVPKESTKSAEVGGACGGGATIGGGVLDGLDIDVIGGDEQGNLYVGSGDSVVLVGADGVSGVMDNTDNNCSGGVIENEDVFEPTNSNTNRGEKEKCSGGEGGAEFISVAQMANTSGGNNVEEMLLGGIDGGGVGDINVELGGGGIFVSEDDTGVGANIESGVESSSVGANSGEESGSVGASGGGANVSVGRNVGHIPLIPRRRLREILAHAQGECMMLLSVLKVCK